MARFVLFGVFLLTPLSGGCATAYNVSCKEEAKVFGGVRLDAKLAYLCLADASGLVPHEEFQYFTRQGNGVVGTAALFDMPLTLAGDTITLPYTALVAWNRAFSASANSDQPPARKEEWDRFWMKEREAAAPDVRYPEAR